MKIKLIDRYNFTKFIDSQEVFGDGERGEGVPSELLYPTPFGEVRFELTGETRKGIPYYRQARRQEEHQPAYDVPGEAYGVPEGTAPRRYNIDPSLLNDMQSVVSTNGWGQSFSATMSQLNELTSAAPPVPRYLLSPGVEALLRDNLTLRTIITVYLSDSSIPEEMRRDVANGHMSRGLFERTLMTYGHVNRLI